MLKISQRDEISRDISELIEISCEKSLCNEISDDSSNEIWPRRRHFEGNKTMAQRNFAHVGVKI